MGSGGDLEINLRPENENKLYCQLHPYLFGFINSFLMIFYSFSMIDGHHGGCWSFGYILHHSHPHYNYENDCIYEIQRKIKSCFCFCRSASVVKLTKWPTTLLTCPSISLPVKCHCFKMYKKIDKGYTSMEAWLILVCSPQNPDRSSKFIFFLLSLTCSCKQKLFMSHLMTF